MHPEHLLMVTKMRMQEDRRAAAVRRQHPRRPRPPSRVRASVASNLVRLAARVADEPVQQVARRVA
jgi:hypothetical protein